MDILLVISLIFIALEILLFSLFLWLRSDFQWLIMGKDRRPFLNQKALEKFIINGYDPELGWVRKPNTENFEKNKNGKTKYTINNIGARTNPGVEEKYPSTVMAIGDSYTFCRQVNDDETWPYFLSKNIEQNTLNFGVGNFGLDQALLRFKRELQRHPNVKTLYIGVVPETISRILCSWKHYSEYGNTFAFKPCFKLHNNKLKYIPNFINSKEKYHSWQKYEAKIQKYDFFYQSKFKKDILEFPYSYSLIKSFKRTLPLVFKLLKRKVSKTDANINAPFQSILKRNQDYSESLYQNK